MKFRFIGLAILAGIVLVGLVYILANRETITAAEFRIGSGYQTAQLSHGETAYQLFGPADGPPLIIVHGGTLGSMAYQGFVLPLVAKGYRVVLYDQYGRGFSDRPTVPFSIDLMRLQLRDLMDHLGIRQVRLYGVSFGGAVIARFAAEHPERVVALAYQVPVIAGANVSMAMQAVRLPLIGPLLMRFYAVPAIITRGQSFATQTEAGRALAAHFTAQFKVRGTQRVMRQLMTGDALSDRMADHRKIGAAGMAAQFVYATDDPEIAPTLVEAALGVYDRPDIHQYTGGHSFSSGRQGELVEKMHIFFSSL